MHSGASAFDRIRIRIDGRNTCTRALVRFVRFHKYIVIHSCSITMMAVSCLTCFSVVDGQHPFHIPTRKFAPLGQLRIAYSFCTLCADYGIWIGIAGMSGVLSMCMLAQHSHVSSMIRFHDIRGLYASQRAKGVYSHRAGDETKAPRQFLTSHRLLPQLGSMESLLRRGLGTRNAAKLAARKAPLT